MVKRGVRFFLVTLLQMVLGGLLIWSSVVLLFTLIPGTYHDDENLAVVVQDVSMPDEFWIRFKTMSLGNTLHNPRLAVSEYLFTKWQVSQGYVFGSLVFILVSVAGSISLIYSRFFKRLYGVMIFINGIPVFVFIPVVILIFGYTLDWFPIKYTPTDPWSVVFVIFLLSVKPICQLVPLIEAKVKEEKNKMYTLVAKAKGISQFMVLVRHIVPNILGSFAIYFMAVVAQLLTGNIVLESSYSVPGIGLAFVDAIIQRDVPVVIGFTFYFGTLVMGLRILTQSLISYLQPSLRESL